MESDPLEDQEHDRETPTSTPVAKTRQKGGEAKDATPPTGVIKEGRKPKRDQ